MSGLKLRAVAQLYQCGTMTAQDAANIDTLARKTVEGKEIYEVVEQYNSGLVSFVEMTNKLYEVIGKDLTGEEA